MGLKPVFLTFFISGLLALAPGVTAQPSGHTHIDTVRYWLSQSEVIDGIGVKLNTREITLIYGRDKSRFTAFLRAQRPDSLRGAHWDTFFSKLAHVPFYFQYTEQHLQSRELDVTYGALDKLMLSLLDDPVTSDPDAFSQAGSWLNGLKPRHELPLSLQRAFAPLEAVFFRTMPGEFHGRDSITGCKGETLVLRHKTNTLDSSLSGDTLQRRRITSYDGLNEHTTYQQLANCLLLDGLDVEITIDGYEKRAEETWLRDKNGFGLISYSYLKQVRMRFGDHTTLRETRVHVVRVP